MDFYFDIGVAVLLRILRDRRELKKYRAAFVKVAHAILSAYEKDDDFQVALQTKLGRVV